MKIIGITAIGQNKQIGLKGKLPWSFPNEYQHYLSTVKGHYVIIGRKNIQSNNGDIEGAYPLVLTRDKSYKNPNALSFHSVDEVLQYAYEAELNQVFIIGGAQVYKEFLPLMHELYLSIVNYDGEADTYFPEYEHYDWEEIESRKEKNFIFKRLVKVPSSFQRHNI